MAEPRIAIGVDVGGSGIKAAVVDADDGRFVSDRLRVPTPSPSTPDAVSASIGRLVKRLVSATGIGPDIPLGLGMPGVVLGGVLKTAANIDPTWVDFPITQRQKNPRRSSSSRFVANPFGTWRSGQPSFCRSKKVPPHAQPDGPTPASSVASRKPPFPSPRRSVLPRAWRWYAGLRSG